MIKEVSGTRFPVFIHSCGKVVRHDGYIYTPFTDKDGYKGVKLVMVDGAHKHFKVHRLVAEAFIHNPDNKPEVNHINEVKSDNGVGNLEWATGKENSSHSNAKSYEVTYKDGAKEVFTNLSDWCKLKGLFSQSVNRVLRGDRKHYHNMKFKKLEVTL